MAFFDKLRDFGEGVASGLSSGSGFETGLALGARAQEGQRSDRRLQMQEDEKTRNRLLSLFRSSPQAAIAQAESEGRTDMVEELNRMQRGQTAETISSSVGDYMSRTSAARTADYESEGRVPNLEADMASLRQSTAELNNRIRSQFGSPTDPGGWQNMLDDKNFMSQHPQIRGLVEHYRKDGVEKYKALASAKERELIYGGMQSNVLLLAEQPSGENFKDAMLEVAELHRQRGGPGSNEAAQRYINSMTDYRTKRVREIVLGILQGAQNQEAIDHARTFDIIGTGDDPLLAAAYKVADKKLAKDDAAAEDLMLSYIGNAADEMLQGNASASSRYIVMYNGLAEVMGMDPIDMEDVTTTARGKHQFELRGQIGTALLDTKALAQMKLNATDAKILESYSQDTLRELFGKKETAETLDVDPVTAMAILQGSIQKMTPEGQQIMMARGKINSYIGQLPDGNIPPVDFERGEKLKGETFTKILHHRINSRLALVFPGQVGQSGEAADSASVEPGRPKPPTAEYLPPAETGAPQVVPGGGSQQHIEGPLTGGAGTSQPDAGAGAPEFNNIRELREWQRNNPPIDSSMVNTARGLAIDVLDSKSGADEVREELIRELSRVTNATSTERARIWDTFSRVTQEQGIDIGELPEQAAESFLGSGSQPDPAAPMDRQYTEGPFPEMSPPEPTAPPEPIIPTRGMMPLEAHRPSVPRGMFSQPPIPETNLPGPPPTGPQPQPLPTGMGGRDLDAPPQLPEETPHVSEGDYWPGRADDVSGWKQGLAPDQIKEVIAATKERMRPITRLTTEHFHETREMLFPRDPGPYPPTTMGSEWLNRAIQPPPQRTPGASPMGTSYGRAR